MEDGHVEMEDCDSEGDEVEVDYVLTEEELQRARNAASETPGVPASLKRSLWAEMFLQNCENEMHTGGMGVFVGPDGEFVPILGLIVACKCPYFRKLFYSDQKEATMEELKMDLMETSPLVFRYFLRFLYTGELEENLSPAELRQMVYLEGKYEPQGLLQLCRVALKDAISVDNVFHIYQTAETFGLSRLAEMAMQFALDRGHDVIQSNGFYDVNADTLMRFLESDELKCREVELFKGLVRWGEAKVREQVFLENTLQGILEPHLKHIRFPIMTGFEIGTHVHPTGLLPAEELLSVYLYLSNPNVEVSMVGRFTTKQRQEQRDNNLANNNTSSNCVYDVNSEDELPDDSTNSEGTFPSITKTWSMETEDNPVLAVTSPLNAGHTPLIPASAQSKANPASDETVEISDEIPIPNNTGGPEVQSVETEGVTKDAQEAVRKTHQIRKKKVAFDQLYSSDSDDETIQKGNHIVGEEFPSWDSYVQKWRTTTKPEDFKWIELKNIKIKSFYPEIVMPQINYYNIDLEIDLADRFSRFERTFDLRRFVFFCNKPGVLLEMDGLWDMGIPISITINGVTLFKISKPDGILTIAYHNDTQEIFSGIGKADPLHTLSILKTSLPKEPKCFPTNHLRHVVMYCVYPRHPFEAGQFFQRCRNLETLVYYGSAGTDKTSFEISLSFIDMEKELSSGSKLTALTLFSTCLFYVPSPRKDRVQFIVKENLSVLYLDQCCLLTNIFDSFHEIFPNLVKFGMRQRDKQSPFRPAELNERHLITTHISARLINNLLKIKSLKWIRIWGKEEEEESIWGSGSFVPEQESPINYNLTPTKRTPNKNSPMKVFSPAAANRTSSRRKTESISDEEITQAQDFLASCGLKRTSYNFMIEKVEDCHEEMNGVENDHSYSSFRWRGTEFNEKETTECDTGFWDLMDQHEFEFYKLDKFYRDYKVFDDCFDLPVELLPTNDLPDAV